MTSPNILHIFTDQQRFDTVRALGNGVIRTPNLDRLCSEGTAFTSAYSPSPVCVPARAAMIYGQYPHNTRCYENNFSMPQDGRHSVMDALSAAGYRTHGVGKCHFTPDGREFLFDRIGDPRETRNRAGLSFTGEPLERMRCAVLDIPRDADEKQVVENDRWKAYPTKTVPEDPDAGLLVQGHEWADARLPGYSH